jgi:alginate O-acetyltransferase complex protein AlgI
MVFSSLEFLFRFLPIILLVYFVAPKRFRNGLLLVASLFFYAWGEPIYVALMVISSAVNFFLALAIDRYRGTSAASSAIAGSVVFSLGLLGFFKYADFLIGTVNDVAGTNVGLLDIPLPIGISFYTFQILTYTIDVYRGNVQVQRNFVALATYIALFPQLIAGPIVRYSTIAKELTQRNHSTEMFVEGVHRFTIGLAKKVLIANNIGLLWEASVATSEPSVMLAWLGIVAFAFQIFFDFSGYSDMAIGLGRMFGFRYTENFNYPYIAQSVTEFWRRWHISLGQWFRDYVYIPLGGNRGSFLLWTRNVLVVWALTGLWHGASWNFALWGLYFGLILMLERLFINSLLLRLPAATRHLYTLLVVLVSWVIFQLGTPSEIFDYLGNMFGANGLEFSNSEARYLFTSNWVLLAIAAIGSMPVARWIGRRLNSSLSVRMIGQPVFYGGLLIISTAFLVDSSFNPFLYFRF